MKKRHWTLFYSKTFYYPLLIAIVFVAGLGCKKTTASDPCDGVLNEGMPTQVGLVFVDKQTGENMLLSKNIDTAAITITPEPDPQFKRGMIVNQPGSPMHGALAFTIADTKEGLFKYKVDIAGLGNATLSYTNKMEKSDNKCRPYYINITEPAIEEHSFTLSRTNYRLVFKVML
jgi:hypothetical protein